MARRPRILLSKVTRYRGCTVSPSRKSRQESKSISRRPVDWSVGLQREDAKTGASKKRYSELMR